MDLLLFSTFSLDMARVTLRGARARPATKQCEKRLSELPSSKVFTTTAFLPAWRPASTITTFPASVVHNNEKWNKNVSFDSAIYGCKNKRRKTCHRVRGWWKCRTIFQNKLLVNVPHFFKHNFNNHPKAELTDDSHGYSLL